MSAAVATHRWTLAMQDANDALYRLAEWRWHAYQAARESFFLLPEDERDDERAWAEVVSARDGYILAGLDWWAAVSGPADPVTFAFDVGDDVQRLGSLLKAVEAAMFS